MIAARLTVVCISGAHGLTIIDAIDGRKAGRAILQIGPVALAVARDGRTAYVLGAEGDITPVSAVTGGTRSLELSATCCSVGI